MKNGYHPSHYEKPKKGSLKEQGFYHWPVWKDTRKLALIRDHYTCQLRISPRCTRHATEVHHIKPLEEYPELALDLDNLTCCCWFCHEETKQRKNKQRENISGIRIIKIAEDFDSLEYD